MHNTKTLRRADADFDSLQASWNLSVVLVARRLSPDENTRVKKRAMGDKPTAELLGSLRSLYCTRNFTDLIISALDNTRHPVHRAIVCPRSKYIADIVEEGRSRDESDGETIVLTDEPEVIRLLIEYLYLLDYHPLTNAIEEGDGSYSSRSTTPSSETSQSVYDTPSSSVLGERYDVSLTGLYCIPTAPALTIHALPEAQIHGHFDRLVDQRRLWDGRGRATPANFPIATAAPNLVVHAKMYTAGSKYGIQGLKALALDKFKIQLARHWNHPEFADAIREVFASTPSSDREMREVVVETLDWHGRLFDKLEVASAIVEINGLAFELLKRSRRHGPDRLR